MRDARAGRADGPAEVAVVDQRVAVLVDRRLDVGDVDDRGGRAAARPPRARRPRPRGGTGGAGRRWSSRRRRPGTSTRPRRAAGRCSRGGRAGRRRARSGRRGPLGACAPPRAGGGRGSRPARPRRPSRPARRGPSPRGRRRSPRRRPRRGPGVDHRPGRRRFADADALGPDRAAEVAPGAARDGPTSRRVGSTSSQWATCCTVAYDTAAWPSRTPSREAAEEVVPGVWTGASRTSGSAAPRAPGTPSRERTASSSSTRCGSRPEALAALGAVSAILPHRAVPPALGLALPPRARARPCGRRRGRGRWRRSPTSATVPATSSRAACGRCTRPGPEEVHFSFLLERRPARSRLLGPAHELRRPRPRLRPFEYHDDPPPTRRTRRGPPRHSTSPSSASTTEARSSTTRNPRSARSSLEPRRRPDALFRTGRRPRANARR